MTCMLSYHFVYRTLIGRNEKMILGICPQQSTFKQNLYNDNTFSPKTFWIKLLFTQFCPSTFNENTILFIIKHVISTIFSRLTRIKCKWYKIPNQKLYSPIVISQNQGNPSKSSSAISLALSSSCCSRSLLS